MNVPSQWGTSGGSFTAGGLFTGRKGCEGCPTAANGQGGVAVRCSPKSYSWCPRRAERTTTGVRGGWPWASHGGCSTKWATSW